MELKEFIKQTITDIKDAISELNQESESDNAVVNPLNIDDLKHPKTEGTHRNVTDIQFDLSLSVMEEKGKEGKLGVMDSIIKFRRLGKNGYRSRECQPNTVYDSRMLSQSYSEEMILPFVMKS